MKLSDLFSLDTLFDACLWLPVILISISFHEYAHGWAANRLGDPTAKFAGRLTLNPLKHFNLFGFLMMLFVHFGWATPVPVNADNFRNPKRDMLMVALAGPGANLLLALVSSLIYSLFAFCLSLLSRVPGGFALIIIQIVASLLLYLIYMNIGLAVFNLIPIEPLDGSYILGFFMPQKYHVFMAKYGQYIQIVFVLFVLLTSVVGNIIGVVQSAVADFFIKMWLIPIQWIVGLF